MVRYAVKLIRMSAKSLLWRFVSVNHSLLGDASYAGWWETWTCSFLLLPAAAHLTGFAATLSRYVRQTNWRLKKGIASLGNMLIVISAETVELDLLMFFPLLPGLSSSSCDRLLLQLWLGHLSVFELNSPLVSACSASFATQVSSTLSRSHIASGADWFPAKQDQGWSDCREAWSGAFWLSQALSSCPVSEAGCCSWDACEGALTGHLNLGWRQLSQGEGV